MKREKQVPKYFFPQNNLSSSMEDLVMDNDTLQETWLEFR